MDLDLTAHRFSNKDRFETLIDTHIDDLLAYGKPLRRSKDAVLRRLKKDLGSEPTGPLIRTETAWASSRRIEADQGVVDPANQCAAKQPEGLQWEWEANGFWAR